MKSAANAIAESKAVQLANVDAKIEALIATGGDERQFALNSPFAETITALEDEGYIVTAVDGNDSVFIVKLPEETP